MLIWALLGASQCCETPRIGYKFNRAYLQNHSELAQTAWQASYTHVMLQLYQKSANLVI